MPEDVFPNDDICQKAISALMKGGCQRGFNGVFEAADKWIFVSSPYGMHGSFCNGIVYVSKIDGKCHDVTLVNVASDLRNSKRLSIPEEYRQEDWKEYWPKQE